MVEEATTRALTSPSLRSRNTRGSRCAAGDGHLGGWPSPPSTSQGVDEIGDVLPLTLAGDLRHPKIELAHQLRSSTCESCVAASQSVVGADAPANLARQVPCCPPRSLQRWPKRETYQGHREADVSERVLAVRAAQRRVARVAC